MNFILGKSVAEHDLPENERTQNIYIKEALLLRQALSLCGSLADEASRYEAAFFDAVRTMIVRLQSGGAGKKFTLPEVNERINELLKQSIKSEGVINLFSDIGTEFSLFDPKFLEEVANMKEKNLAVELLKKLIAEQVSIYRRTNLVKSEKFSETIQSAMNRYLNGMLTNEEVIQELLKLAKDIAKANAEGEALGLNTEEHISPQAEKSFFFTPESLTAALSNAPPPAAALWSFPYGSVCGTERGTYPSGREMPWRIPKRHYSRRTGLCFLWGRKWTPEALWLL